jgi:small subunit ribosomal protein S21|tara:strand:+ start:2080 stop:2277 length:198 start_codon:yes stop_codon:yes gene_type:complete
LVKVEVRKGQSIEKAISIFKKKVKKSGLMLELRKRSFYVKPSAIKREEKNKAILRNKYKVLKEKD